MGGRAGLSETVRWLVGVGQWFLQCASSQMTEILGFGWVCSIGSLRLLFHPFLWLHAPVPAVWLSVPTSLVRRLSHSTLQTPQTPPLARHVITLFLGVGSMGLHTKPWLCLLFSSCLLTWDPPIHSSLAFAMTQFCCPTFCPSTHHGSVLKKSIL